jgi:hypothetical protein
MRWSTMVLASVALVGCSEFSVVPKDEGAQGPGPDILVTPPQLVYGTLSIGDEEQQVFSVQNIGEATLHVENVVIKSGLGFSVTAAETVFDLEPGDSRDVEVTFTPMGAHENYGEVAVFSDDSDQPEANVGLLGYGAVPELKITPESYVFGDAFVPCGSSVELTLENVGTEDLVIEDYDYISGGLLTLDDSNFPPLPLILPIGATANVTVDFTPATAGSDTGRFDVVSNDPRGTVSADQNGEGTYVDERTETFTEPSLPGVDVMILIDQSCSMEEDNVDDVQNGFPDFVTELQAVSDWQLMLITDYAGADAGCGTGGVMDSSTNNISNLLVNNAFPGSQGIGNYDTEALLRLADTALSKTGPGGCNEGFLRPGALLHVVVLSDEREQSGRTGGYWVGQLGTYVSAPDFLKVSGVLDLNTNCGDGSGPDGYLEAVNLTGGASLNICNANWGAQFSDIASEIVAGIRSYNLSDTPDPASVTVTVNGNRTNDFDVNGSSITINDPPVGEGDEVEIEYGVLDECN